MSDDPKNSPPPAVKPFEDAGTQALSEALASSFKLVKVIMILLVVVFLGSGIREVGSHERAIKLQFGKPVGVGEAALLESGWHWAWPYPVNEIVKIPIGQVQEVRSTVGYYGITREQELQGVEPPMMRSLDPVWNGYLLTGDGNIMHSRATLRYRITDPIRYSFHFTHASNIVQNCLNNALQWSAGQFNVDDAVRKDVTGFKDSVRRHVSDLLIAEDLGVAIENIEINSIPPRQVKDAFDAVLGAENTRSKDISEAQARANGMIARAAGEAQAIVNMARTEADQQIQSVKADARYFQDQLTHYRDNPNLYLGRLQAEYVGRVMTNVQTKIILTEADGTSRHELRLQLSREGAKPPPPRPPEQ